MKHHEEIALILDEVNLSTDTTTEQLTEQLYSQYYALKSSARSSGPVHFSDLPVDEHFIAQLSAHNLSIDRIEDHWQIRSVINAHWVEVYRAGQTRSVHSSRLLRDSPDAPLTKNEHVRVHYPKGDAVIQHGFYYAFSDQPFDNDYLLLRVYWNLEPEGAPLLISSISRLLNHYNIPFSFKCLNHPELYKRRDTAVLYLSNRYYHTVSQLLPQICAEVKDQLQSDIPLFTHRYLDGVGMAENPLSNESFGISRMKLVANALLSCHEKGIHKI
ncbi:MAG: T3SS effector HopA1 family protein [Bacteroidota bacterium]